MSKVSKTLPDFTSGLKNEQFHQEILDSSINTTLLGITTVGANISIDFDSTLSTGEENTLETLITNHIPDYSKPRKSFFLVTPKGKTDSSNYQVITSFKYPGSNIIGDIDYIEIVSNMENSISSYDVRIICTSTGSILVESTGINNLDLEAIDLGTVSNVPTESSILELQVRKNGGGKTKSVYIDNLIIYYNN